MTVISVAKNFNSSPLLRKGRCTSFRRNVRRVPPIYQQIILDLSFFPFLFFVPTSNGLQPKGDGFQSNSSGSILFWDEVFCPDDKPLA